MQPFCVTVAQYLEEVENIIEIVLEEVEMLIEIVPF